LKFLPKQISEVASVTLAVQLLLLPLTIYYFDNLQIWSILANIIFAPILTLVTLASFLGLSFILNPTLDFFKYLVSLTHDLPYINASMQISLSHMVLLTILINFLAIIIFQPFKDLQMKEFRPDQYFEENFLVLLQKLCSNRYTQVSILASSLLMLLATTLDPIGVKSYHIDNGLVANKQLQEILKSKKHFGYFDIDGHKALIIKSPRTLKKMDLLLNNLQEVEFLFLPNLSSKDIYFDTLIKLLKPQFVVISSYKENEKIKTNTETIASQSQTIINSGVLFISKNKFWSLKGD